MRSGGRVYVVGAGPGDPELMTVKARRLLEDADVVLHDGLVGEDVVDLIPSSVDAVDVGKDHDAGRTPQAEINRLMVEHARAGEDVVRLKGGDPFVFGRGGEEMQHLASRGVEFEVVPGVSSSVAAAGVAGVPVTHRDQASSFAVVTGHEDPAKQESSLDWGALAANVEAGGTLVVLMGVGRLPDYVAELRRHDLPPETPVAMIERASLEGSRTVTAKLGSIVDTAREHEIEPPATTVVGDVVEVRDDVVEWMADDGVREAVRTAAVERGDELGAAHHG